MTSEYDEENDQFYAVIKGGGIDTRIPSTNSVYIKRNVFYVDGPENVGSYLEEVPEDLTQLPFETTMYTSN